jgi:hypothetical protein
MFFTITVESFYFSAISKLLKNLIIFLNTKIYIKDFNIKNKVFDIKIIFLPKKIKKYTLNKSPHVNKTAREQFEIRTYKAIINVFPLFILKKESFIVLLYFLKNFLKNNKISSLLKSKITLKF